MPRARGKRIRIANGIYRDQKGCSAVVAIGSGDGRRQREKRYPKGTDLDVMRRWQAETRLTLLTSAAARRPSKDTLAADVHAYTPSIRSRACAEARGYELDAWVTVFGHRKRSDLTVPLLQGQLEKWRAAGLAASTLNHRISSLAAVYKAHGDAPPELRRYREPDPKPRAMTYQDVEDILSAMPPGASRAVFRVMAYTGLPPVRLKRLSRRDVNLDARTVFLEGRQKGEGTAPKTMPLTAKGVQAFKAFLAVKMTVPASSTMTVTFRRGVAAANVERAKRKAAPIPPCRPYDLRHTFGTWAYAQTKDLEAVATLLDCSRETAMRYALGAVVPNVQAIVEGLNKAW